jgi:hypothetical protein
MRTAYLRYVVHQRTPTITTHRVHAPNEDFVIEASEYRSVDVVWVVLPVDKKSFGRGECVLVYCLVFG